VAARLPDEYVAKAMQDARRFQGCWDAGTSGALAAHTYRLIREREELVGTIEKLEAENAALRSAVEARHAGSAAPETSPLNCGIPQEFFDANRNATLVPAKPAEQGELEPFMVGSSMPAEAAKAAWDAIKEKHRRLSDSVRSSVPLDSVEDRRPRLIGITGRAGAGKNLAASMVTDATIIGLADPIYEMLAVMLDCEVSDLRDRDRKELAIDWLQRSPRQLLQTLGTEWGRKQVCEDVWIKIACRRIDGLVSNGDTVIVVADVRFDNEASMIRARGGEVWEITRDDAGERLEHSSEDGISRQLVDRAIPNNGTIDELRRHVQAALAG
jgi:hypothetical protein